MKFKYTIGMKKDKEYIKKNNIETYIILVTNNQKCICLYFANKIK